MYFVLSYFLFISIFVSNFLLWSRVEFVHSHDEKNLHQWIKVRIERTFSLIQHFFSFSSFCIFTYLYLNLYFTCVLVVTVTCSIVVTVATATVVVVVCCCYCQLNFSFHNLWIFSIYFVGYLLKKYLFHIQFIFLFIIFLSIL